MGGGYVLSGDVARTLVGVNRAMKLKFTPIEDATLGFWLMAMDLRHVDHERFYTWAASCCFETLEHDKDKEINGEQQPTKVKVMDAVVDDLCTDDPWLVLHKIDSPTKMRALGDEARKCGPTPPLESIARAGGGQPWRPPGRSGGGGSGSGNGGSGGGSAAEVESAVERGTGSRRRVPERRERRRARSGSRAGRGGLLPSPTAPLLLPTRRRRMLPRR